MRFVKTYEHKIELYNGTFQKSVKVVLPYGSDKHYYNNLRISCDADFFDKISLTINNHTIDCMDKKGCNILKSIYNVRDNCVPFSATTGNNYLPSNQPHIGIIFEKNLIFNTDEFMLWIDVYEKEMNDPTKIRIKDVQHKTVQYKTLDCDLYTFLIKEHPEIILQMDKPIDSFKDDGLYGIITENNNIKKIVIYKKETVKTVSKGYIYNSEVDQQVTTKLFSYELIK